MPILYKAINYLRTQARLVPLLDIDMREYSFIDSDWNPAR